MGKGDLLDWLVGWIGFIGCIGLIDWLQGLFNLKLQKRLQPVLFVQWEQ